MRFLLSAALIGLPLLDIATLILIGQRIGAWRTVALVVLSAFSGVLLIRSQGLAILTQARKALTAGSFPARQVFDGACVLIGGILLIVPGFASDALGLMLLLPPCRTLLLALIGRQVRQSGRFAFWSVDWPAEPTRERGTTIIEGEYETLPPEPREAELVEEKPPLPDSPWRR